MEHTPESLGYRIEYQNKTVVYSGDTDVCDNIITLGKGADVMILDSSFPDEMKTQGHLTPSEAGKIAKECGCKRLVLSHLYPVCQPEQIIQQAKKVFKGEVVAASDLLRIKL